MWRFYLLTRSEWLAIVFAAIIVGALTLLAFNGYWRLLPNFGFSSDWRCTYVARGEPVCVKDPPAKPD
jgi:hypothetical protein